MPRLAQAPGAPCRPLATASFPARNGLMQGNPGDAARAFQRLRAVRIAAPLRGPLADQAGLVADGHLALTGVAVGVGTDLEDDETGKVDGLRDLQPQTVGASHDIIGAREADGSRMLERFAGAARVGHLGQARAVTLVGGSHACLRHTPAASVKEPEEIAATDIVGPLPGLVGGHRADHHGPHVEDAALGLNLVGLVTDALAPRSEGALVPELIAAPADQAELRVRRGGDPAPVAVDEDQLQFDIRPRRQPKVRESVEPHAGIHAAFRPAMPVLAQLHRNAERMPIRISQHGGHARDGRADALAEAAGVLFKQQPRRLLAVGGIREHQSHALHGVVLLLATACWDDRLDTVQVDAVPAVRGVVVHGACGTAGQFAGLHVQGLGASDSKVTGLRSRDTSCQSGLLHVGSAETPTAGAVCLAVWSE